MRHETLVLKEMFLRAFARFGTRPAVRARDGELSYAELFAQASALSSVLQARGIGPGDHVVLLLRNSVEFVIADIALILAGAGKVPLNDMLAADDVGYMIGHSGAKAVIAHTSFQPTLGAIPDALAGVGVKLSFSDSEDTPEGFGAARPLMSEHAGLMSDAVPASTDPGLIIYTGGTTGRPKGVYHTQASLCVNFMSHLINAEIRPDERLLICSPLPHSAQQFVLSALLTGAYVVIEPGYDVDAVLDLIAGERLTWMFMVPTMIYRLLDSPRLADVDHSSLRTIVYGASPITAARLRQGLEVFGPIFLQIYGQTEIPNLVTTLSKTDHLVPEFQTSCGQPVIFCDVVIRDADGNALPPGEAGEITVRSFYTLERYHDAPKVTAESYLGDYLRTGDLGYMDDTRHVYLVDRAKDMIISGGMNVYSTEVENALQEHADVGQVVVIGVPDDDWGEAVTAFVIPDAAAQAPDPEAIRVFAKGRLARYKVPKQVRLVEAIPLTPYGKPDKKALRAQFWGEGRQIN